MALTDWTGWASAVILLAAYHAGTRGRGQAVRVHIANAVGSLGLGSMSAAHHAWPSVGLNAIWLIIAAAALRSRRLHPNADVKQPTARRAGVALEEPVAPAGSATIAS
ncbi:hypothetical protein GCM10007967_28140 [Xylanimonas ulmi]|uniref:CBU-0592-like domain-containing protein n=1 Tax=Xylanimonas ulmi TaxID=228973 RepID=A0A4Q7M198_9MICO|nr:hypothetical protein EV386_0977 [Xylanibacterium ulmi]